MTRLKRDYHRSKLRSFLARANDADFLVLTWAVYQLRYGDTKLAARYIEFPADADAKGFDGPYGVFPWQLEALANELLATPKQAPPGPGQRISILNCRTFGAMGMCVNALRGWEDGAYSIHLNSENVLHEMTRIGHQQFEWQRGYDNIASFYRSAFIYGGDQARAYFLAENGCSLDDFVLVGFALFAAFMSQPVVAENFDFSSLGASRELVAKSVSKLSLPIWGAREKAAQLRTGTGNPAYAPSLLRPHPIIRIGPSPGRLVAPLPPLLIQRITDGIYYDVIGGPDGIKTEIGERFERYCLDVLQALLGKLKAEKELKYRRSAKAEVASPDILIRENDVLKLAIECKAKRMPFDSRFGEEPVGEGDRGFEEIAKGVMQIWRFFADIRLGRVPSTREDNAFGMLLTLDPWPQMATEFGHRVRARALALAMNSAPEIQEEDRRPVALVYINDFELALRDASDEGLLKALRASTDKEGAGWMIFDLVKGIEPDLRRETRSDYPFKDRIYDVLPWWRQYGDGGDNGG